MHKAVQLRLAVPEISLHYWMPGDEDDLTFEFRRGNITGSIYINLDPEAAEYDDLMDTGGDWFRVPLSCSRVVVRVEAECNGETTDREFLEAAKERADKHLNDMLTYVRCELGQYWVGSMRISDWNLNYFLDRADACWIEGHDQTRVLEGINKAFALPPDRAFETPEISDFYSTVSLDRAKWDRIATFVREGKPYADLTRTFMANAKRYFDEGEYRMATVEAVTALDVLLPTFVRERLQERAIRLPSARAPHIAWTLALLPLVLRDKELDDWLPRLELVPLGEVAKEIPADVESEPSLESPASPWITAEHDLQGKDVIDRCVSLNSLRNKIVHDGKVPQSKQDIDTIRSGIQAAELLVEFVRSVAPSGP
ncbi:MAG TPA: hypothetical protein VMW58_05000 [Anaerolineae bacterium]|nr:hypothetical protein [Anaerolineae bacterium]